MGISDGFALEDVVFSWREDSPLSMDDSINLPQYKITKTETEVCTRNYSTGNHGNSKFHCLGLIGCHYIAIIFITIYTKRTLKNSKIVNCYIRRLLNEIR